MARAFTVLGLETSCDETAAAVVRGRAPGPGEILSNIVLSQMEEHRPYGGVVPEIAARAHVEAIDAIVEQALAQAGVTLDDLDAIAATAGPGLIGGVMVGLTTGKALALAANKPLIAINHLEAHALTPRLTDGAEFPLLLLLISGGHCQLLGVEGVGNFHLYGTTIDDAVGEAFDKCAKLLGLAYPGGPYIEALAQQGNAKTVPLPRPLKGRAGADFSFAGLKTAVRLVAEQGRHDKADIAAAFQAAVIDVLTDRTRAAMAMFSHDFPKAKDPAFVVAGGVAANRAIGSALGGLAAAEGFQIKIPPPKLCTDNAAMIAWAGVERSQLGLFDPLDAAPKARWPLAGVPIGGSRALGTPAKT
ncbi:MAG TPA: tRNA (adenosine(37)-N6)-threonylcarbamoyltransferase complex transferase subunit TsaD [Rhizomicrobium sp.]|jgi:N6-L-threonylcarbamoyladenine synthase|nr:tRNA (adenosine(37)-N6)-threonylcarbamoyltransferase complex transferase subunit TsaD [Rhizomicrobium sp.]